MSKYTVIRFKIQLEETDVWREFEVKGYTSLEELHEIIQVIMGWKNIHLYHFKIGNELVTEPNPEFPTPESIYNLETRLNKIFTKVGQSCEYIYDFGDNWVHNLEVTRIYKYTLQDIGRDVMNGGDKKFPFCLDGAKKCPPEDVGSIPGYQKFVEAMNTKNINYERYLKWHKSHYDENEFDLKKINKKLSKELWQI